MIRLPDFVVIGAARCATTSLYEYLRQHPQVFMSPEKETDYFSLGDLPQDEVPPGASRYRARTRAEYEAQFALAGDARAAGEASPTYLFYPRSADRMRQVIPDAKLICVLRDPVERAYSHWALARRSGFEPLADFEAGVAAEGERWRQDWSMRHTYARASLYHDGLRAFIDRFPRERILVLMFEEFVRDPLVVMREVYRYIGVEENFVPDVGVRYNRSLLPRNALVREAFGRHPRLRRLLLRNLSPRVATRIGDLLMRRPPGLDPRVRARLLPRFEADVRALERLLDRDLGDWLKP